MVIQNVHQCDNNYCDDINGKEDRFLSGYTREMLIALALSHN